MSLATFLLRNINPLRQRFVDRTETRHLTVAHLIICGGIYADTFVTLIVSLGVYRDLAIYPYSIATVWVSARLARNFIKKRARRIPTAEEKKLLLLASITFWTFLGYGLKLFFYLNSIPSTEWQSASLAFAIAFPLAFGVHLGVIYWGLSTHEVEFTPIPVDDRFIR